MSRALNSIMLNCFEEFKYVVEFYVVPLNWKLAGCWHSLSREERASHVTLIRYRHAKPGVAHAPGMPGTFPRHRGLAIPSCITARASRTCRDACRDHLLSVFFEVCGGENVPTITDACATRNFYVSGKRPIFHGTELVFLKYSAYRNSAYPAGRIVTQLKNTSAKSCYPNAITYAIMNIR